MRNRRVLIACLATACLLSCAMAALWLNNPTVDIAASDIDAQGPAGNVECSIAPWDARLNQNDDAPGGEHSGAYSEEVASECYLASKTRFDIGAGLGTLALAISALGAWSLRSNRERPRLSSLSS